MRATSALYGLRVLDLTSQLSGPYCAMILADLGADVVKLEAPGAGDNMRSFAPHVNGESAPFMTVNRNKRSIAVDLKARDGLAVALRLAAPAVVVLENWRPGTAARLGVGEKQVRAVNPSVIYCSISGFGQTGPYAPRGGFDRIALGMAGVMSVNGPEDGPPYPIPIPVADIGTGMFGAIAVLAALAHRTRTGEGQAIDTSLLETPIAWSIYEASSYFATGQTPARLGPGHRTSAPYQAFRTADGWMTIGAGSQQLWETVCGVLDTRPLLADPRFATGALRAEHRAELEALLAPILIAHPTAVWLERFEAAGVPSGPILTYDEVFADPHVKAREMVVDVEHPA